MTMKVVDETQPAFTHIYLLKLGGIVEFYAVPLY